MHDKYNININKYNFLYWLFLVTDFIIILVENNTVVIPTM